MSERSAVWIRSLDGFLEILVEERFVEPDLISRWNLVYRERVSVIADSLVSEIIEPEFKPIAVEPCGPEFNG